MKKNIGSKKCLVCGGKFVKARGEAKAKAYCGEHFTRAKSLRALRQPCRMTYCKNPSHEDGYCDPCRPYSSETVPFRDEWLEGVGLIKTNTPNCRYVPSQKIEKGSTRCAAINDRIKLIHRTLNG
jgi:hypothetical protein